MSRGWKFVRTLRLQIGGVPSAPDSGMGEEEDPGLGP